MPNNSGKRRKRKLEKEEYGEEERYLSDKIHYTRLTVFTAASLLYEFFIETEVDLNLNAATMVRNLVIAVNGIQLAKNNKLRHHALMVSRMHQMHYGKMQILSKKLKNQLQSKSAE